MLSTQLNPMAEQDQLAPNCVCLIKRHVTNVLKDGRYGFIFGFRPLSLLLLYIINIFTLITLS